MALCRKIKVQKKKEFRRKLHILRGLINSNSDKTSSIIMDAFLCISALTLKLQDLKRESVKQHMKYIDHAQLPSMEVKVEKEGKNGFRVNVKSEKGKGNLVNMLETFDEMGINVIDARVSCITHFAMEARVEVNQDIDSSVLTEAVHKAVVKSSVISS